MTSLKTGLLASALAAFCLTSAVAQEHQQPPAATPPAAMTMTPNMPTTVTPQTEKEEARLERRAQRQAARKAKRADCRSQGRGQGLKRQELRDFVKTCVKQ